MLPIICIQSPIVGPKVWARAMKPDDVSTSRPAAMTTYFTVRDIIPHLHTHKGTRPAASGNGENNERRCQSPDMLSEPDRSGQCRVDQSLPPALRSRDTRTI